MCQGRKQFKCAMWAGAGHLCHCQTTLFLLPSCHPHCSTPLQGTAWHQSPSCFLSPLLVRAAERAQGGWQSVPAMLFVPLTEPSCLKVKGTCHPAGTCCALGSHGKSSWGMKSPVIAEKHQICFICYCNCLRDQVCVNFQTIYTLQ